jgi:hypothetical protein
LLLQHHIVAEELWQLHFCQYGTAYAHQGANGGYYFFHCFLFFLSLGTIEKL